LTRLLAHKGWKATELAAKAGVPQSRISELRKSDRPYMPLMQTLADALGVELWEFFVTDEQARVLRHLDTAQKNAISEEALIDRAMVKLRGVLLEAHAELSGQSVAPPANPLAAPQLAPPLKKKKRA
jgi:transcriptional regulator with XRE-family HTH domain